MKKPGRCTDTLTRTVQERTRRGGSRARAHEPLWIDIDAAVVPRPKHAS